MNDDLSMRQRGLPLGTGTGLGGRGCYRHPQRPEQDVSGDSVHATTGLPKDGGNTILFHDSAPLITIIRRNPRPDEAGRILGTDGSGRVVKTAVAGSPRTYETQAGPSSETPLTLSLANEWERRRQSFVPEEHYYFPQPVAYILGGGPSLGDFDVSQLRKRFTIGCNDAYRFGSDIVNVCLYNDPSWWAKHRVRACECFDGPIIGADEKANGDPRLRWIATETRGIYGLGDNKIGYNYSTGAMAINLAARFGAKVIILLGFDMTLDSNGKSNWHVNECTDVVPEQYRCVFKKGFEDIRREMPKVFPDVTILNANLDSRMGCPVDDPDHDIFPKIAREKALELY